MILFTAYYLGIFLLYTSCPYATVNRHLFPKEFLINSKIVHEKSVYQLPLFSFSQDICARTKHEITKLEVNCRKGSEFVCRDLAPLRRSSKRVWTSLLKFFFRSNALVKKHSILDGAFSKTAMSKSLHFTASVTSISLLLLFARLRTRIP